MYKFQKCITWLNRLLLATTRYKHFQNNLFTKNVLSAIISIVKWVGLKRFWTIYKDTFIILYTMNQ